MIMAAMIEFSLGGATNHQQQHKFAVFKARVCSD